MGLLGALSHMVLSNLLRALKWASFSNTRKAEITTFSHIDASKIAYSLLPSSDYIGLLS